MPASAAERSLAAQVAAHTAWAHCDDRAARTAPARAAALARFEREVDPDGVLSPTERAKRADNARRAYFARLSLSAAAARRKSRELADAARAAEAELAELDQP